MLAEYFNTESAFIGNPSENVHDVIIHGLDQSLEYSGNPVFYPVEPFQKQVEAWNGLDAVYIPNGTHIPTGEYNANPEAALKKYGGKRVGEFQNAQVITAGNPRLQSRAEITDSEVEKAILKGNIKLSSAFNATGTDAIEGNISPSYILLFDKTAVNPRDKTSMFLNSRTPSEETNMAEDAVKIANLERDLKEEQAAVERLNTDLESKDTKVSELEGTVERLNSEAEANETKIAKLEEMVTEYANNEANMQWEGLKATRIPKGLVTKAEDEKTLRQLYNTDKDAFYGKIMDVARPAETNAEGSEFNNSEDAGKAPSVGNWNPYTQKFED